MKFVQDFNSKANFLELMSKGCRCSKKTEKPSRNDYSPEKNKGKPPHQNKI